MIQGCDYTLPWQFSPSHCSTMFSGERHAQDHQPSHFNKDEHHNTSFLGHTTQRSGCFQNCKHTFKHDKRACHPLKKPGHKEEYGECMDEARKARRTCRSECRSAKAGRKGGEGGDSKSHKSEVTDLWLGFMVPSMRNRARGNAFL